MKNESYFGLYRAYGATIMAFGPFLGINLSLYEKMKQLLNLDSQKIQLHHSFFIALTTGLVASLVTNPLEVPKI